MTTTGNKKIGGGGGSKKNKKKKKTNPFIDDEAKEVDDVDDDDDNNGQPPTPPTPTVVLDDYTDVEGDDDDDDGYYQMSRAMSPQTSPIQPTDPYDDDDKYVAVSNPDIIGNVCFEDKNSTIDVSPLEITADKLLTMHNKFHATDFQVTLYQGQWYRYGSHRRWIEDSCRDSRSSTYCPQPMKTMIHLSYDKEEFDSLLETMPESGIKGMLCDWQTMEVNLQHAVDLEHNKKLQNELDEANKKYDQLKPQVKELEMRLEELRDRVDDVENAENKERLFGYLVKMLDDTKRVISHLDEEKAQKLAQEGM